MKNRIRNVIFMKIREIAELLNAKIYHLPPDIYIDIEHVGTSDLMSDVLAYLSDNIILITGLLSPQVIRTVSLMDISAVIFTRGKIPTPDILEAAEHNDIAILATEMTNYSTSGILYSAGLSSVGLKSFNEDENAA